MEINNRTKAFSALLFLAMVVGLITHCLEGRAQTKKSTVSRIAKSKHSIPRLSEAQAKANCTQECNTSACVAYWEGKHPLSADDFARDIRDYYKAQTGPMLPDAVKAKMPVLGCSEVFVIKHQNVSFYFANYPSGEQNMVEVGYEGGLLNSIMVAPFISMNFYLVERTTNKDKPDILIKVERTPMVNEYYDVSFPPTIK